MACNESSDCSTATDLLNFVRSIIAVSKLSTLRLHFAHLRFSKRRHRSTLPTLERFNILDASQAFLASFYQTMLLYGGYKPQRIHKSGTPMPFSLTRILKFCQNTRL